MCPGHAGLRTHRLDATAGRSHRPGTAEPKRLRLRLFSTAARLVRTGRRTIVHLARHGAWTDVLLHGLTRLRALADPG